MGGVRIVLNRILPVLKNTLIPNNLFLGCVVTVAGKLSVKLGQQSTSGPHYWHVLILVTDGSETIKASLSPEILQNWLGVCPTVYMSMSDDKKAKVKEKMKKVSEKLMTLNAIMKIRIKDKDIDPEVIDITEINRGHAQQLKIRQK